MAVPDRRACEDSITHSALDLFTARYRLNCESPCKAWGWPSLIVPRGNSTFWAAEHMENPRYRARIGKSRTVLRSCHTGVALMVGLAAILLEGDSRR